MLENTRWRLLLGLEMTASDSVEANAVSIKKIRFVPADAALAEELAVRVDMRYYGDTAVFVAQSAGIQNGEKWYYKWEESTDGGTTWTELVGENGEEIYKPVEGYTGNFYRATAITDKDRQAVSAPVQLTAMPDKLDVSLLFYAAAEGAVATFNASPYGPGSDNIVDYTWERSYDGGKSWDIIEFAKNASYSVLTDEEHLGNMYRVTVKSSDGQEATSNVRMLVMRVASTSSDATRDGTADTGTGAGSDSSTGGSSSPTTPSSTTQQNGQGQSQDPQNTVKVEAQAENGRTVSVQEVSDIVVDGAPGSSASQPNTGNPSSTTLYIDSEVTEQVNAATAQQEQQRQLELQRQPGARWSEISKIDDETRDGVDKVLEGNPMAPFTAPLGAALVVTGGLERILAFRRQKLIPSIGL
jgi:hypothetical protein